MNNHCQEMRNKSKSFALLLFLYGLGSVTKVYFFGLIAISELVAFFVAPFLFLRHAREFQRNELMPVVYFVVALILGCFVVSRVSGWGLVMFVKQGAIYYSLFGQFVVLYYLVSRSPHSIGWLFLGSFFSGIITIFAFNSQIDLTATGFGYSVDRSAEDMIDDVLFLYPKINDCITLPIKWAYLRIPLIYSFCAGPVCACVAFLASVSGRSAAATSLLSSSIIFFGRKSRRQIALIGKHMGKFVLAGFIMAILAKEVYVYTASHGYLGEEAQIKYNVQVRKSTLLGVLMGGRSEFFIGMRAILDHPILGFIEGLEDRHGYTADFITNYGNYEDMQRYIRVKEINIRHGHINEMIPIHSSLVQFWGLSGLPGAIFWCWVFVQIYMYFRKYASAIPQWFGMMAIIIPPYIFSVLFNPYKRMFTAEVLVFLLVSKSVWKRKIKLPIEMELEAQKYDK